jgi:lipoprotein NlpI
MPFVERRRQGAENLRVKLAPLVLTCALLAPAARAAESSSATHPLLMLARELEASRERAPQIDHEAPDLRSAEHALSQSHAPADADCAGSLGASAFADLHAEVAAARSAQGDFAGAAQAYRHALACTPRSARVLHNLADALFNARDIPGAAEYVQRALEINPRAVYITVLAGNIDFAAGHWADAMSRYRYAAASEPDRTRAAYWQLMYWLTQARAGVQQPEYVTRRHTDGWPKPLLLYLQGQYSEAELVMAVREGENEYTDHGRDERLCEALYYVGEARLARGQAELARDYFAAAVNIKMIRFNEHGLALAEIARMSAPGDQRAR